MRRRWRHVWIEVAVVAALFAAVGFWRTRDHARGPLPDMTLPALDGRRVPLRDLGAGRARVVAFFAPWCGVCKQTAQNVRWTAGLAGDAAVVSVASGWDDIQTVRAYVAEHRPAGTVLLDEGDRLARQLGVTAYPTFFFVSAGGEIVGSTVGYTTTLGLLLRWWLA